ncbi:MAG: dephospho-CoA kinase [Peptoniphilaceae bacterium]|nr:dephospho-CoA kinase [Peptoniphilaceae bacterium]MDY6018591.1 dephospho-CoA kinase [Anaerococcus sp.]
MSQNRIIITGSIASGKSTLANLLRQMGYRVIDADKVNSKLLEKDGLNYRAIKESGLFDLAFEEDRLDKKKLAQLIFSDKDKMDAINNLTHRNIISTIEQKIETCKDQIIFIEIALFFSMKEPIKYDQVWLVDANRDLQIQRLMKRDKISYAYALKKIESQAKRKEMIDRSDFVFDNSYDLDNLKKQLLEKLKEVEKNR